MLTVPLELPVKADPRALHGGESNGKHSGVPSPTGLGDGALCPCLSRMVPPTLFFWPLVARLGPHACGQGAPDRGNHPTPVTPSAPSTFPNNSHSVFSPYRRTVAANPGKNIISSPLSFSTPPRLAGSPGQASSTHPGPRGSGPAPRPGPRQHGHEHFSRQLLAPLRSLEACQPHTGSTLSVDQRQYLSHRFVDIAQNLSHTEVFLIPFGNSQVARE